MPRASFSHLTALARTPSVLLTRSAEIGALVLVLASGKSSVSLYELGCERPSRSMMLWCVSYCCVSGAFARQCAGFQQSLLSSAEKTVLSPSTLLLSRQVTCFLCAEPSLHPRGSVHMVMVLDPSNVLLDSAEAFCTYL